MFDSFLSHICERIETLTDARSRASYQTLFDEYKAWSDGRDDASSFTLRKLVDAIEKSVEEKCATFGFKVESVLKKTTFKAGGKTVKGFHIVSV